MLDLLLNAIYRQFIRAALPGLASQAAVLAAAIVAACFTY